MMNLRASQIGATSIHYQDGDGMCSSKGNDTYIFYQNRICLSLCSKYVSSQTKICLET